MGESTPRAEMPMTIEPTVVPAHPMTISGVMTMPAETPLLAESTFPPNLPSNPALTGTSPDSNVKKMKREKRKLDLTIQEDDCRLLQFFPHVSHKVFEQQALIEFEKIAKRCKEHQMERELETRKKVERIRANA